MIGGINLLLLHVIIYKIVENQVLKPEIMVILKSGKIKIRRDSSRSQPEPAGASRAEAEPKTEPEPASRSQKPSQAKSVGAGAKPSRPAHPAGDS